MRLSFQVLVPAIVVASGFFIVVIWLAVKAQMRKHFTGAEAMIGSEAEVMKDIDNEGEVFLMGEYWKATSKEPVKKGAKVRVIQVDGLKLIVEEIKNKK